MNNSVESRVSITITLLFVILTDYYLAIINVATTLFPFATTLIYIWYANKAVFAQCISVQELKYSRASL